MQWVGWLVKDLNGYMRKENFDEGMDTIEYLNKKQLKRANITGMQAIFHHRVEEKNKAILLSEVSQYYVLEAIDHADIPEEKSKPKRAIIVTVMKMAASFISIILVLMMDVFRGNIKLYKDIV